MRWSDCWWLLYRFLLLHQFCQYLIFGTFSQISLCISQVATGEWVAHQNPGILYILTTKEKGSISFWFKAKLLEIILSWCSFLLCFDMWCQYHTPPWVQVDFWENQKFPTHSKDLKKGHASASVKTQLYFSQYGDFSYSWRVIVKRLALWVLSQQYLKS